MINDESIRKLMELNLSEMVEVIQRQEHVCVIASKYPKRS